MYQNFEIQHRLRILTTRHPNSVQPQTTLTYTAKLFVITTFITMPHLNNHRVVHRDVNVTIAVARVVHNDIQVKVDVVIGGRWTRKCRGVRVVGAACVNHHARQRNDVTIGRCLIVDCGVSRETNEV